MVTLTERRKIARGWAGYRASYTRNGRLAVVLNGVESGIDSDPENPWVVLCDDHGTLVTTPSLAQAKSVARDRDTTFWCGECRQEAPDA